MVYMEHEFGDIRLFNLALAQNRDKPPIDEYLRSAGLSESEIAEVRSVFDLFCAAIENAPEEGLPDIAEIASAVMVDASFGTASTN